MKKNKKTLYFETMFDVLLANMICRPYKMCCFSYVIDYIEFFSS
jgi:hypothetical protein